MDQRTSEALCITELDKTLGGTIWISAYLTSSIGVTLFAITLIWLRF